MTIMGSIISPAPDVISPAAGVISHSAADASVIIFYLAADAPAERIGAASAAAPLQEVVNTPAAKYARRTGDTVMPAAE